jgi:TolB-like protein/DNA-binding winged helix-turn-helix (wHTH) protein/Tfp pilus assembly protein PilF
VLEPLAFGPFVLDPRGKLLFRDGRPVALGARAVALLQALLAANGETLSKSELLDAAWPGVVVEENNLTVQVAALRKALGARPDGVEWIGTVPRVGYRLQLPGDAPALPAPATIPALAVLPFQNLSGDPNEDYLADGIVEDITSALSRFRAFTVTARSSAFLYKGRAVDVREAARDLRVAYVLQGSVRRSSDGLRIGTQLLSGETGLNLWAQNFDGRSEDVFRMQDRIVESVVGVVAPEILYAEIDRARRKGADNLQAYDLYLQAMYAGQSMTTTGNAEAGLLIERAIALDPNYAPALIYAAWVLEHRITMGWPGAVADRDRMVDYADRALASAPTDAYVMAMAAEILMAARLYDRSLPLARRALEMNPNYVFVLLFAGIVLMQVGDLDEAEDALGRAVRLNPHDPFGHGALSALAHVRLMRSDYEGAIAWAERSMAVNRTYGSTHWIMIAANVHMGRLDEAQRLLAAYRAIAPHVTLSTVRAGRPNAHPERAAFVLEGLRLAGLPES